MDRWDTIIYLLVFGAMLLDWLFAAHAFNEGDICAGLKNFAGIVLLGLGYIATLLRDQRRKQ